MTNLMRMLITWAKERGFPVDFLQVERPESNEAKETEPKEEPSSEGE